MIDYGHFVELCHFVLLLSPKFSLSDIILIAQFAKLLY